MINIKTNFFDVGGVLIKDFLKLNDTTEPLIRRLEFIETEPGHMVKP